MTRTWSLLSLCAILWLALPSVQADDCVLSSTPGEDDGPNLARALNECALVVVPTDVTLNISTLLNTSDIHDTTLSVAGTIKFNPDIAYWSGNAAMFAFQNASTSWLFGGTNITMTGGGTLDGSGQAWYDAFAANASLIRPIILTIFHGEDVLVENVTFLNSPQWFNLVYESQDVVYQNINITSFSTGDNRPANTDGWDTFRSDSVTIKDSVVDNGDDCVSFKPNSTNILVSNLSCTGSHGISLGSLGQYPGQFDIVENVTAINVIMRNAENGARIKAWAGPDVGSGIVRNITFENFAVTNADLLLTIDQCYMTDADECAEFPSNTFLENVWFRNITGTSSEETVASLLCSPDGRCTNINVDELDLTAGEGTAEYECDNIRLQGTAASLFPEDCQA